MTRTGLRGLTALGGLFFLALGIGFLALPEHFSAQFGLMLTGSTGLSTLRADLSGLFLGVGAFSLVGAVKSDPRWLTVPAVFLAAIVVGRVVSFAVDGHAPFSVFSFGLEVVLLAVVLGTRRVLR
jgi:Domain of unknown function (DUF4345)